MEASMEEPMTGEQLKELMSCQGWTTRRLAIALDVTERTITRYRTEESGIPKERIPALQALDKRS
jgi:transcriptional regulator with XRE-family HTH domain